MIIKIKMCSHRVFASFRKFTPPQASQLHGENASILLQQLEKGFQKKPLVAFPNSTVFIQDFYICG